MTARHPRILCIETDDTAREIRCEVLGECGSTTSATPAQWAALLRSDGPFDLIVLGTGLSDQEKIMMRSQAGRTPVLQLSGFTPPEQLLARVRQALADHPIQNSGQA